MDLSRYVDNKSKSDLNETERDALLRCQNKKGGNFIGSLHKTGTVMVERTSDSGLITHNFCQFIYTFSKAFPVNRAGERCATSSIRSRTRTRCSRALARRLRPSSSALSTRSGSTTLRTLGAGDDRCLLCHAGRARGRGNTDTVTCMSVSVTLPWSESLLGYDFGVGHPMAPVRLRLTVELLEALGLLADPGLHLVDAPVAEDGVLTAVHEAA